ncbi:hypothetical protein GJAV_G00095040 [Gymnothorax javanicus]|nr:hypothetical protein GJAV_G00095040 [Gymnothorax javanicus]
MSYTCISCRVAFADGEVQRAHYKTDWHRYNLKRKVADMPPVTAENFQERVLAQRAAAEEHLQGEMAWCATCSKKFSSGNAFQNHLQSHKHQEAEKRALLAAQRKVEKMNEKNVEKGLEESPMDNNAKNEALQQALREQQKGSPAKMGKVQAAPQERLERGLPDKPPRLQWFEEQARRIKVGDKEADMEDEEWEDVEEDEDDDDDDDEDMMEEEVEGVVEAEGERDGEVSGAHAVLPPGAIPVTDCLFCTHHSRSLLKNLAHMTKVHSFFLPDVEYLVDLKGIIQYLGEKVGVGKVCLWCNEKGKSFYSTEAVQAHMTDKSHCKLYTDGDAALEFADFYDFRSSYPDQKDGMDDGEDELPDKNLEYDDETMELTLPSGAKIGHRSLMRYYKQRFGAPRTVAVVRNQNAVGRVLRQYRALGWAGDAGTEAGLRAQKDMRYVQRMKSKWMLKTGVQNNATKQMHFRAQVIF